MDALLAQAARYSAGLAIRSGISIAGGFAIRQVSTYISKVPENSYKQELELVSKRLDQKIKIVTPAIDLIEIIAARGNTTLNSTVQLTVSLRNDINAFGQHMNEVMAANDAPQSSAEHARKIIVDMKALLARIEDAVPLISLALTTSGANLSASLPSTVSPSRLLQASSFLQEADARFGSTGIRETQVGPSFSLKLYTIFEGHARQQQDPSVTNITWQETYARSILEVIRMPMKADVTHDETQSREHKIDYLYHFRITENMDDGRYHEEIERGTYRRDQQGFIRGAYRDIPVHNVARLFFSASGRLLNIEEARTPVLVLKINHSLKGPSATFRAIFAGGDDGQDAVDADHENVGETVQDDLEWIALESWADDELEGSDLDNFDTASEASYSEKSDLIEPVAGAEHSQAEEASDMDDLAMQLQVLDMSKSTSISPRTGQTQQDVATLSLLEYILRLCALQTSEQDSVLSISDERISLFLRDENSQSRSKSRPEAEAVRRSSNDRFDTPASSIQYDEFIPGTQIRTRKGRRSRQSTPLSNAATPNPFPSQLLRGENSRERTGKTRTRFMHARYDELNMSGARNPGSVDPSHESPLVVKSSGDRSSNLFKSASDSQSSTTNSFSNRLRESVKAVSVGTSDRGMGGKDDAPSTAPSDDGADAHHRFMSMAIDEAKKSIYIPSAFCVGCVIVKDDKVISTGYSRELEGNTHAEQCALDKMPDLAAAQGADMYTTMEPCSVRLSGNLPCVQRVIAAKIARIYQGVREPADFVACDGSDLLRKAGIQVFTVPGFEAEAIAIARGQKRIT